MHTKWPLYFLVLSFAMFWIPLGQHAFLYEHWMKLGTFIAPFLMFIAFSGRDPKTPVHRDIKLLSVFMMVFYIIHQFEEHWIDIFGNVYAFQNFLNGTLRSFLSITDQNISLISSADIFFINTSLVWLVACIAILCAPKYIFPALCMAGIMMINAICHSISGLRGLSYNPGLLTSLVIFIPFALWFYYSVLNRNIAKRKWVLWSLAWAFIAHIILMAGLVLVNHTEVIPPVVYYVVLVIWSIIPAFIGTEYPAHSLSNRA